MADRRPNFLLFITDQHHADFLGCYGHPTVQTPNIDAIAAAGTRFDNFFVNNPVCMPNRATLMTGRLSSQHKVRSNGIPLPLGSVTFPDLLMAQGYDTALIGKSHLQTMTGRPPIAGKPAPKFADTAPSVELSEAVRPVPGEASYDQEHPKHWQGNEPLKMTLPFYGFGHVDLLTGHGQRVGGHYYQWLKTQTADADAYRDTDNQLDHDYVCPQAHRMKLPEELHPTNYLANQAVEYLAAPGRKDTPFFAMVSFPDPHHPFTPPGKYWDMYDPADMELPRSFGLPDDQVPPSVLWAREQRATGQGSDGESAMAVGEREVREALALTCGMITLVDDAIGRVMAQLRSNGLDQETVIVFMSDHGDYLGSHGLLLKGPLHYRDIIRTPFIWADPKRQTVGSVSTDAMCSTMDVAASILERAEIEPNNGMTGESVGDVLTGGSERNDPVIIEDDGQRTYMGYPSAPKVRTVVTKEWRLTVAHNVEWGELYDLRNDPDEINNLWDSPAHIEDKSAMLLKLVKRQAELSDTSPWPTYRA
jgi:arylsulfatase A-like enzyme